MVCTNEYELGAWRSMPAPYLTSMPMPSYLHFPELAPEDPVFINLHRTAGADIHWSTDEVAFVSTADALQDVNKTEALACKVPSLVRHAGKGDLQAVEELLKSGEDPNVEDDFGMTALHCSAKKGDRKIVALLLAHGARVSSCAENWKGEMPIHYACKYGHSKIVKMLLTFGADPHALTQDGRSPMDLAKDKKHAACVEVLLEAERLSSQLIEPTVHL